ncbi:hypothetical protein [Thauera sp. AutoDN2]|uniref:hypothetical protein n=1 Tax=Thauera sp. AutoDN2 TaxID=3416051 RepID=UPI003F4B3370
MLKRRRKDISPSQLMILRAKKLPRSKGGSLLSIERQRTKLDFGWVPFFTLSITVFTAVVFGAGKAYRQNYLASFGFDDSVIPWLFQDVVYLGITKQLPILLTAPMVAIGAVFGFAVLIGVLLWIGDRLAARRTMPRGNNKAVTKNSTESLLDVGQFVLNCLGSVFLFGLLALFFVARAENLGSLDAKSEIESVAQGSSNKPKMPYVTIERLVGGQKIIEAGYLVSCSERACGLYSPNKGKEASRLVSLDGVTSFSITQ